MSDKPTIGQLKERRAAWVAALRSGKYQQGWKRLTRVMPHGEELHCCLGVACKVAIELGLCVRVEDKGDRKTYEFDGCELQPLIRRFFGLRDGAGGTQAVNLAGENLVLAKMNDGGKSFLEIADFIESNPPGLWQEGT